MTAVEDQQHENHEEEQVFCSDGLDRVKFEVAAPPVLATAGAVLEECESMNPHSAFEVFQGKTMYSSGGGSGRLSREYPMDRLARLKREVEELQVDLQATSNPQSDGDNATNELQQVALELAQQLAVVEQQHSKSGNLQSHLSRVLEAEIGKLKMSKADDDRTHSTSGIKYELYAAPGSSTDVAALEMRLGALERVLLGPSTSSALSNQPLLERLNQVEIFLQQISGEDSLNEVAARAKVIRADLEAAAKARNKIGSGVMSLDNKSKVLELHQQMLAVKDMAAELPLVVERCHSLANLHTQAADSLSRLVAVEQSCKSTEILLQHLSNTLTSLEQSTVENLQIMQQSLEALK